MLESLARRAARRARAPVANARLARVTRVRERHVDGDVFAEGVCGRKNTSWLYFLESQV